MGERGFSEPVRAEDAVEVRQKLKPQRWEKHDLTLIFVGATLGCMVTILFMAGIITMIGAR